MGDQSRSRRNDLTESSQLHAKQSDSSLVAGKPPWFFESGLELHWNGICSSNKSSLPWIDGIYQLQIPLLGAFFQYLCWCKGEGKQSYSVAALQKLLYKDLTRFDSVHQTTLHRQRSRENKVVIPTSP